MHGSEGKDDAHSTPQADPRSKLFPRVIGSLAIVGVMVTWGDRHRFAILYVTVIVYAASVILFFIYARYRYPLVPFLIVFAAAALAHGATWLRDRSPRQRSRSWSSTA